MPRFVVLRHDLPDGSFHFYLMLERGGALATWRISAALGDLPADGAEACRLDDHRLHYLTHEGDLGGGRGSVRRVDEGTYEASAWQAGRIEAALAGRGKAYTLEMTAGASVGALWRLRCRSRTAAGDSSRQ